MVATASQPRQDVRSFLNVNSTIGGELSDTSVCSTMHLGFDFSRRLFDTWNRKPLSHERTESRWQPQTKKTASASAAKARDTAHGGGARGGEAAH
jgi:hypothetical protein